MKKNLLLTACLAFASLSSFGASLASIMLQHNGNVTMYDPDKMSSALSDAVAGDTIYMSEGAFTGDFTINKAVCIIGAGQNTKIQGNITISIDNTPTLTAHMLDAVSMGNNSVTVSKAVKNLKFRKCYFNSLTINASTTDLSIDRCRIEDFYPQTNVKSGNVLNSYFYRLRGASSQTNTINFINCNIYYFYNYSNALSATFINCLICSYDWNTQINNCVFINTRYPSNFSIQATTSVQNCWTGGTFTQYTEEATNVSYYTIDAEWLQNNNYLGTDGTIIGMFGGTSPYSLVPNVPTVTESKVSVDTANKKLNVSLKVTAN